MKKRLTNESRFRPERMFYDESIHSKKFVDCKEFVIRTHLQCSPRSFFINQFLFFTALKLEKFKYYFYETFRCLSGSRTQNRISA